jgi:hypothetical protein
MSQMEVNYLPSLKAVCHRIHNKALKTAREQGHRAPDGLIFILTEKGAQHVENESDGTNVGEGRCSHSHRGAVSSQVPDGNAMSEERDQSLQRSQLHRQ